MEEEIKELLDQFRKQKESAWANLCTMENDFKITDGYTHDFTEGVHAAFLFAEKELKKIIFK